MDAAADRVHGGLIRGDLRWHGDLDAGTRIGLSWYSIAAGDECSVHVHTGKIETWFFTAGAADVLWGDERIRVTVGDAVRTRPGVPHGIKALDGEAVRFLNIVQYLDGVEVTTTELDTRI